jgi:hypothetical protein
MPSNLRIPFGLSLHDGFLYEPRSVPLGKACNCVCPACERPLYSKHCIGGRIAPHFQHAPGVECAQGYETALHLAAKQLIEQRRLLIFPELVAKAEVQDALGGRHTAKKQLIPEGIRFLEDVALEQKLGRMRPDLIVSAIGVGPVLIEIAVTHFVDEEKLQKIRDSQLPAIEIDISDLRAASFDALTTVLFEVARYSSWLYHPQLEAAQPQLLESLQPALENAKAQALELEKQAREREKVWAKEREEAQREDRALYRAQRQARREEHARAAGFKARPEAEKLQILTRRLGVDRLLEASRIRVRGGRSFGVSDPHIWQATLFGGLIHGQAANGHAWVKKDFAVEWLRHRFEVTPEFPESEQVAVWDYLVGLAERGALLRRRQDYFHIMVASYSAFETLAAFRAGKVSAEQGLTWTSSWPTRQTSIALAKAHGDLPALYGHWEQVSTLLPSAGTRPPAAIIEMYANWHISLKEMTEYLIGAGFLVQAPPTIAG